MKNPISTIKAPLALAAALLAIGVSADVFENPPRRYAPQTWFHLIGGNVSREGLTADLEAISSAGIGGIQFFHGSGKVWPRTKEQIPCLSEKWDSLVGFTGEECRRLGLSFDMQNCPGWSMSGGPWITHEKAMRRLVCFEPGKRPDFKEDDDYREICTVEFPSPAGYGEDVHKPLSVTGKGRSRVYTFEKPVTVRSVTMPNSNAMGLINWTCQHNISLALSVDDGNGWKEVFSRALPRGAWQDDQDITFQVPETTAAKWKLEFNSRRSIRFPEVSFSPVARLDNWQALGGWCLRDFRAKGSYPVFGAPAAARKVKLVFGHVNMKKKNAPAPEEATGWECDKLDPIGANATFDAYIGRLADGPLKGGLLGGLLLDSWECCCQNWTWKMEEYFRRINGYDLRPNLPVIFGYPVADAGKTEKFLRDWRRTLARLVEENFYGTMAKRAAEKGLKVYFETAFNDVLPGDPMRYWKYADVPMCEFWQPYNYHHGYIGSDDFKPIRMCVSAAHIYGKERVAAEALTSFALTWNENFRLFKDVADRNLFRGVTRLIFHTYTHNPQTGKDFLPPGSSFGCGIGSPFLRGQTWWKFMPEFVSYFTRCGYMLERGKPVVDILWMLGDDFAYRPPENVPFPEGYKYDYCNADALITRADARDGRIVFPDGMSYTALWIPEGTFLLPETEKKIDTLAKKGAKIIRGKLEIDWPSQLDKLDFKPAEWYQRRDGDEDIFFVRLPCGDTAFVTIADGKKKVLDPVTGRERAAWQDSFAKNKAVETLDLKPLADYPQWATERVYAGTLHSSAAEGASVLSLGKVRDWAVVYVNGMKAATLWCEPYACDIAPFLKEGGNEIKVVVTSTWFNKLVHDASLPEEKRTTWTIQGPGKNAKMREAGLYGPVELRSGAPAPSFTVETLTKNLWRVREEGTAGSLMNRYGTIRDFPVLSSVVSDGKAVSLAGEKISAQKTEKGFTIRFPLAPDERVYGLGDASRASLQRRPGVYDIYVRNVASYIPIPMVITSKGRGFLINTTFPSVIDVGKRDKDAIVCTAKEGTVDFYVFTGRDFRSLLDTYTSLTGKSTLLPAFAFGFSFVCNQWIDAMDLLQEAREFRDRSLPCDVLGLEPGWMETFYDFTTRKRWDPARFYMPYWMKSTSPNFFTRPLDRMGFKLSLWLCCNYDLTRYEEELLQGKWKDVMKPGVKPVDLDETFIDDHILNPRKIDDPRYNVECGRGPVLGPEGSRPWFEHLKYFCDTGARCFKLDAASQVNPSSRKWANGRSDGENHNVYSLIYAKQMSEGYETYTGRRSMVYTSCGYAGIQRYVATWAGDTGGGAGSMVSCLNLAVSGHSNQSCDMTVFDRRARQSPEGIHFGFLSPWSQQNNWDYHNQPWYQKDEDIKAFRAMVNLRYRLFPYLYGAAAEAHRTGWPMMRPLAFVYPERADYADVTTTYMLGDDLLVTAFSDECIVPPGEWYDFFTGEKVKGPSRRKASYTGTRGGSLLVRAGAVVPMWPLKQHIDRGWNEEVELHVWPGDGKATLYEDDGDSLAYRRGEYALTRIINRSGKVEISKRDGSFKGMPGTPPRFIVVNEPAGR